MTRLNVFSFGFLISLTLIIQSCGPLVLVMDQTPGLQGGSPLNAIEPKTFMVKDFRDERGSVKEIFGDESVVSKMRARMNKN